MPSWFLIFQTKYDDQILNLNSFEQQFNENRPFYGRYRPIQQRDLVYSRRIGGSPLYPTAKDKRVIIDNPSSVDLINALKVSGRTKKDWSGENAVTKKDICYNWKQRHKKQEEKKWSPCQIYNVLVLDQRFRKNSAVSLINTNVTRNGSFRDGNVSALVWDLNTTKNTYNLSGNFKYSYVTDVMDKRDINSLNIGNLAVNTDIVWVQI
jgi:hypothetical protein